MATQLAVSASSSVSSSFFKKYGLLLALLAMAAVFILPTPADLTTSGHRMLGILVFAVIIWITETVTYPVSATIIATLMILCLGLSPDPQDPAKLLGTSSALKMAFAGVSASGTVLVGAALFLAAAMMHTGLDKRIALFVLSKVGAKTNRILAGMIFVGFVLAFFVPSTTARGSHCAGHHCGFQDEAEQPFCSSLDDCYGTGGQHLEYRHQDGRRPEHGGPGLY